MRIKAFMEHLPLFLPSKEKFLHSLERKAISIILGITYAFMSERRYKEDGLEIFTKVVRKTKVL